MKNNTHIKNHDPTWDKSIIIFLVFVWSRHTTTYRHQYQNALQLNSNQNKLHLCDNMQIRQRDQNISNILNLIIDTATIWKMNESTKTANSPSWEGDISAKDLRTFINKEQINEDGEFTILETSRRAKSRDILQLSQTLHDRYNNTTLCDMAPPSMHHHCNHQQTNGQSTWNAWWKWNGRGQPSTDHHPSIKDSNWTTNNARRQISTSTCKNHSATSTSTYGCRHRMEVNEYQMEANEHWMEVNEHRMEVNEHQMEGDWQQRWYIEWRWMNIGWRWMNTKWRRMSIKWRWMNIKWWWMDNGWRWMDNGGE